MTAVTHDTLSFTRRIEAPIAAVWDAFADPEQRALWSVPAEHAQVYDEAAFEVRGRDLYRCGPPNALDVEGVVDYIQIVPRSLIIHLDTVSRHGRMLATALLTWEFEAEGEGTVVRLTDQVTSLVGPDMIDGHRNGHTIALDQLRDFARASNGPLTRG